MYLLGLSKPIEFWFGLVLVLLWFWFVCFVLERRSHSVAQDSPKFMIPALEPPGARIQVCITVLSPHLRGSCTLHYRLNTVIMQGSTWCWIMRKALFYYLKPKEINTLIPQPRGQLLIELYVEKYFKDIEISFYW